MNSPLKVGALGDTGDSDWGNDGEFAWLKAIASNLVAWNQVMQGKIKAFIRLCVEIWKFRLQELHKKTCLNILAALCGFRNL